MSAGPEDVNLDQKILSGDQEMLKENRDSKNRIQYLIESSLIDELMLTPKPGLVDDYDRGGMDEAVDMSVLLKGINAITPYLTDLFYAGYGWEKEPEFMFDALRPLGDQAETSMFRATGGIDTHRGLIFSMGIICAAAGYDYAQRGENRVASILKLTERIMKGPVGRFYDGINQDRPRTNGESIFLKYGIRGIRGEAENGFPIIRRVSLPAMAEYRRKHPDPEQNSAILTNVLLHIMTALEDTRVISQSDPGGLRWVQNRARYILALGGAFTREGMDEIWDWNDDCSSIHISPVGSGEILAATLFLWRLSGSIFVI